MFPFFIDQCRWTLAKHLSDGALLCGDFLLSISTFVLAARDTGFLSIVLNAGFSVSLTYCVICVGEWVALGSVNGRCIQGEYFSFQRISSFF